jgi:endo-alpha-1,4-polygalactosaminidase (GH114 family)
MSCGFTVRTRTSAQATAAHSPPALPNYANASGIQAGPTTIPLQFKIQLHASNIRHRVGVIVNTTETVTERQRSQYRGRLSSIRNREHVFYAHVGVAIDADAPTHAISNFFSVIIHAV